MKPSKVMQQSREAEEFRKRVSPDGKTVCCPSCNEPHGLWYRMGPKGKKSLLYACNKQKHYWWTKEPGREPVEHWKQVTRSFEAPVLIDGLDLYVDWTPAKKAEHQKKEQFQLPIPTTRK